MLFRLKVHGSSCARTKGQLNSHLGMEVATRADGCASSSSGLLHVLEPLATRAKQQSPKCCDCQRSRWTRSEQRETNLPPPPWGACISCTPSATSSPVRASLSCVFAVCHSSLVNVPSAARRDVRNVWRRVSSACGKMPIAGYEVHSDWARSSEPQDALSVKGPKRKNEPRLG